MMINVEFNGGQGRKINAAVNYMLAEVDGIELYAEMEIPENANPDEYGYDELKDEIIAQAKEKADAMMDEVTVQHDALIEKNEAEIEENHESETE